MKVILPSYIHQENYGKNTISWEIVNSSTYGNFTSSVGSIRGVDHIILQNTEEGEILILGNKSSSKIQDAFEKVMIIKEGTLDIPSLPKNIYEWVKHPKITKDYQIEDDTNLEVLTSWKTGVEIKKESKEINEQGFRAPQVGAIYSILSYFTVHDEVATVVMPTGTGKTETMLGTFLQLGDGKLLVTVPSDALRTQIGNKFIDLGILRSFGMLDNNCLSPIVGILKSKIQDLDEMKKFIGKTNVIVTTMNILGGYSQEMQKEFGDLFKYLFIDEAHHTPAKKWNAFKEYFGKKYIIQFTATPYRRDKKLIEGKIIYDYPLATAQKEEYFKKIDFIPLHIFDDEKVDIEISKKAVEILEKDLSKGLNHIIMARCENIKHAKEIFNTHYKHYTHLNPILIHSDLKGSEKIEVLRILKNLETRIVVCADMLGEGYDLPNLKIAAIHHPHRSLGVTLQFIGRFTRVASPDIGDATFIANISDQKFGDSLKELFSEDSDWGKIISEKSDKIILKQKKLKDFISQFTTFDVEEIEIRLENLKIPYSGTFYQVGGITWNDDTVKKCLKECFNDDNIIYSVNNDEKVIIVIERISGFPKFGSLKELEERNWVLHIICVDQDNDSAYILSDQKGRKDSIVNNFSTSFKLIEQDDVFKAFYGFKRLQLFIVGLSEAISGREKYRMIAGVDIEESISGSVRRNKRRSNVFATGYEYGNLTSIGASRKGKIWTKDNGNILEWKEWCSKVIKKLKNPAINGDDVLKGSLQSKSVDTRPELLPVNIEWEENIYKEYDRYEFGCSDKSISGIGLEYIDIILHNPQESGDIEFRIVSDDSFDATYRSKIYKNSGNNKYIIEHIAGDELQIKKGSKDYDDILNFLNNNHPTIRFYNGTFIQGNYLTEIDYSSCAYNLDHITTDNWDGVDIKKESQGLLPHPLKEDSIQFYMFEKLQKSDYSILFNDDGSGEIADIVAISVNNTSQTITLELYHCKYSKEHRPGARVGDLYEVCGQAQKSIKWVNIDDMLRQLKKRGGDNENRFIKGDMKDLEIISNKSQSYEIQKKYYIVQPGLSKGKISDSQKELLCVTAEYLKETHNIPLRVLASE